MKSPIKWYGGKAYHAKRIVDMMPTEGLNTYVEPYCGGAHVLFARPFDGWAEVINDKDSWLTHFWRALRDNFDALKRLLECTPYSQNEFNAADELTGDFVENARRLFVRCRQSFSANQKDWALGVRLRNGTLEGASSWVRAIEGLEVVHERLRHVTICNQPAIKLIRKMDGPNVLFYLDPPYLHETRSKPNVYRYEMTYQEHAHLLGVLHELRGTWFLSGYRSKLYDAQGWRCIELDAVKHAGSVGTLATECIWTNRC